MTPASIPFNNSCTPLLLSFVVFPSGVFVVARARAAAAVAATAGASSSF